MNGRDPDRDQPDLGDLGFEIPDDLSSLDPASTVPDLAVLITQIAGAEPLAAACALAQIDADVVATDVGALAVCRDLSDGAPQRAAAAISGLVKGVPLVLVVRRAEQLSATRWENGAQADELAPGLVLGGAPEVLEDLLTGQTSVADLTGVVPSKGISRLKAMRLLTAAARKARKR
ncbi:hypothetical protein [Oerskovia flava]|uniref:hypothetical protein n=1 Tax=Oerskovia flava TaxID=2986422 RepID=UPI0022402CD0|nr:hypothetical protein [Oerskovia sp. JB1-3-2]